MPGTNRRNFASLKVGAFLIMQRSALMVRVRNQCLVMTAVLLHGCRTRKAENGSKLVTKVMYALTTLLITRRILFGLLVMFMAIILTVCSVPQLEPGLVLHGQVKIQVRVTQRK